MIKRLFSTINLLRESIAKLLDFDSPLRQLGVGRVRSQDAPHYNGYAEECEEGSERYCFGQFAWEEVDNGRGVECEEYLFELGQLYEGFILQVSLQITACRCYTPLIYLQMARNYWHRRHLPNSPLDHYLHSTMRLLWHVMLLLVLPLPLLLRLLWGMLRRKEGQADEASGRPIFERRSKARISGSCANDGRGFGWKTRTTSVCTV